MRSISSTLKYRNSLHLCLFGAVFFTALYPDLAHALPEIDLDWDFGFPGADAGGAAAAFDDRHIREGVCQLLALIEGPLGALLTTVAGIGAVVSSAFGAYRAGYSMVVVACGSFCMRSLVSLWFGVFSCVITGAGEGDPLGRFMNDVMGRSAPSMARQATSGVAEGDVAGAGARCESLGISSSSGGAYDSCLDCQLYGSCGNTAAYLSNNRGRTVPDALPAESGFANNNASASRRSNNGFKSASDFEGATNQERPNEATRRAALAKIERSIKRTAISERIRSSKPQMAAPPSPYASLGTRECGAYRGSESWLRCVEAVASPRAGSGMNASAACYNIGGLAIGSPDYENCMAMLRESPYFNTSLLDARGKACTDLYKFGSDWRNCIAGCSGGNCGQLTVAEATCAQLGKDPYGGKGLSSWRSCQSCVQSALRSCGGNSQCETEAAASAARTCG